MEGSKPLADPEPSENKTASSAPPKPRGESTGAPQQLDDGVTERFVNTKLNIALINDPKNGPRFTMTKREAGLDGEANGKAEARAGSDNEAIAKEHPSPEGEARRARTAEADARDDGDASLPADAVARPEPSASVGPAPKLSMPNPVTPSGVPPPAAVPSKLPIDSAKTFVGLNGTYYDESWRWMDWRGTRRSWNWPAALSFGHWFAYRRLYGFATAHLLLFAGLAAAIVNNFPIIALILPVLAMIGLAGVYGNTLYFLSFRRAVNRVTERSEGSYDQRRGQLAASGGTSPVSVGMMAVLSIGSVIGALYASFQIRGAFLFNFWPFF